MKIHLNYKSILTLLLLCTALSTFASRPLAILSAVHWNNEPVTWLIDRNNEQVTIHWQLHRAAQVEYIAIEKTTDKQTYELVAVVPKKGNSYQVQYTFQDAANRTDSLFFRLNLTDTQNEMVYTAYVELPPLKTEIGLKVYPHPASGRDIHLTFEQAIKQPVQVTIQDMLGRVHYQNFYHQPGQSLHIQPGISTQPLAAGSYLLTVSSGQYLSRQIFQVD